MSVATEAILAAVRSMPKPQRTVVLCSPEGLRLLRETIPEGDGVSGLGSVPVFVAYSAFEAWKVYREETEAGSRVILCGWALADFPDFDLTPPPPPPVPDESSFAAIRQRAMERLGWDVLRRCVYETF